MPYAIIKFPKKKCLSSDPCQTQLSIRDPPPLSPPPLENFLIHAWFCNIFGYYVRLGLFSNKAKALLHEIGFHTSILTSDIIILQYNKTCSLQYQRNETRGLWSLRRNLKSAQVLVFMTVHYPSFSNFFFNFFKLSFYIITINNP